MKEGGTNFLWRNWRQYVDYRSLTSDIKYCYSLERSANLIDTLFFHR